MLQHALQSIYGVGRVRVAMKDLLGDGTVAVCGMLRVMSCVRFIVLLHTLTLYFFTLGLLLLGAAEPQYSSIWFLDFKGDRPPMRVSYGDTSNTRQWRDGQTALTLASGTPVLAMLSRFTISCPPCPGK